MRLIINLALLAAVVLFALWQRVEAKQADYLPRLDRPTETTGDPVQAGLFQRMTFLPGSPPGAGATLPKITPISGASIFVEMYSSPV